MGAFDLLFIHPAVNISNLFLLIDELCVILLSTTKLLVHSILVALGISPVINKSSINIFLSIDKCCYFVF